MDQKEVALRNELLTTLSFIEWMDYEKIILDFNQDFLESNQHVNQDYLIKVLTKMEQQGLIISQKQESGLYYKRILNKKMSLWKKIMNKLFFLPLGMLFLSASCQGKEIPGKTPNQNSVAQMHQFKPIKLKADKISWYKTVFPQMVKADQAIIPDPLNPDGPVNTALLRIKDGKDNLLGYVREVATTTGCNDGCYPIIFTIFLTPEGKYLQLKSSEGLTKRDHEPMTTEDLLRLDFIIQNMPQEFLSLKHPKEMVDGITSETKPIFVGKVVPQAAYSSYRISMYVKQTMDEIKTSAK